MVPASPQSTGQVATPTGCAVAVDLLAVAFHFQLLQVGRQQGQRLAVGQHAAVDAPRKSVFHRPSRASVSGRLALGRRFDEVLVHGAGAGQQLLELAPADGQRQRQADGRPQRKAPADPVPEFEDVVGGDAELPRQFEIGRHGDEVLADGALAAGCRDQPGAGGARVGHGLLRGEGLAGDDEQRGARIEPGEQRGDVGAIDIGDEMDVQVRLVLGGAAPWPPCADRGRSRRCRY